MVNQYIDCRRQPLRRICVVCQLRINTLIIRIVYNTLLIRIVQESTHWRALTRLLDIQLMVVRNRGTSSLILPIRIIQRITVCIKEIWIIKPISTVQRPIFTLPLILVFQTNHECVTPLLGVHRIHLTSDMACADRSLIANLYTFTIFLTTLRSYHDNTIGTTSTVDSGSGSIFQDLHRLDIIRVHQVEVLHNNTVYHI